MLHITSSHSSLQFSSAPSVVLLEAAANSIHKQSHDRLKRRLFEKPSTKEKLLSQKLWIFLLIIDCSFNIVRKRSYKACMSQFGQGQLIHYWFFKNIGFYVPKQQYDSEARCSGTLWINFDHLGFVNVHPMHGTREFLHFAPIEMSHRGQDLIPCPRA